MLAKVVAKWLALVMDKLVEKAQTWAAPGRSTHDNLHLMRYFIERVVKEAGLGEVF